MMSCPDNLLGFIIGILVLCFIWSYVFHALQERKNMKLSMARFKAIEQERDKYKSDFIMLHNQLFTTQRELIQFKQFYAEATDLNMRYATVLLTERQQTDMLRNELTFIKKFYNPPKYDPATYEPETSPPKE
jgi:hypothetical protein